ncbi:hypothetical protein ACFLS9_06180 [Bacteroidota bacterium]
MYIKFLFEYRYYVILIILISPIIIYSQTPTFNPVPWPNNLQSFTFNGTPIYDLKTQDQSNGGTSPQGYVNLSSGEPDGSLPTAYFGYDGMNIFVRTRLESSPNSYRIGNQGPSMVSNSDPWNSATWIMIMDVDGNGFFDFAIFLDGGSGTSSTPMDRIKIIYNSLNNINSADFTQSGVYLLAEQYAAQAWTTGPFAGTLKQFDGNGNVVSTNPWPDGKNTTLFDYGTARIEDQTAIGGDYILEFQMPLSLFDASAYGGPVITDSTPVRVAFVTSNSPLNIFQKDFNFLGTFTADAGSIFPTGDIITFGGGVILPPLIRSLDAGDCPNVTLSTAIMDAAKVLADGTTVVLTIASVQFFYWYDTNGDGIANETNETWHLIGNGNPFTFDTWTINWDTGSLLQGKYIIKVIATDEQNYTTDSYIQNTINGYNNVSAVLDNTCGTNFSTSSKSFVDTNGGSAAAEDTLIYSITVINSGVGDVTSVTVTDTIPSGVTLISGSISNSGTLSGGTISWSSFTIAGGSSKTLTYQVTVNSDVQDNSVQTNIANIFAGGGSQTLYSSFTAFNRPVMSMSKSVDKANAFPGDTLTYTIFYANNGTGAADFVNITDVSPIQTTYIPQSVVLNGVTKTDEDDEDEVTVVSAIITVNVGIVPIGGSGTIKFKVIIN